MKVSKALITLERLGWIVRTGTHRHGRTGRPIVIWQVNIVKVVAWIRWRQQL